MSGSSLLERYAAAQAETPAEETERYVPFKLGQRPRPERRLRLNFENGVIALMSYAYLTELLCTSHQHVSLIYTNCVITLSGRNLFELIDHIQQEKLAEVYAYNPLHFQAPAEDQMVILSIHRQTLQEAMGRGV